MAFNPGLATILPFGGFGIFSGGATDIDLISGVADIYYDESHNMPVTKTNYPVEDGSSRTDNYVAEPEQLVLKGLVSALKPQLPGLVNIADGNRSKEAWGRIRALKNSGELVTAVTKLGVYENMLITNADAVINQGTGESLFFVLVLEKTLIGKTGLVKLAPVKLSAPAEKKGSDANGGQKQAEEPGEDDGTLLQAVVGAIAGVFD